MKQNKIVFVGAARTPIGKYLGSLKEISVQDLGRMTLEHTLESSKIDKNLVDEIIVGNVISTQTASNIAAVIGIDMGLKPDFTAMTVNRICGSGMQSAINAYQELHFGKKDLIAVGGIEVMSRSPLQLPENSRFQGSKIGNIEIIDTNLACLHSASGTYKNIANMGLTAENIAKKYNISRQDQDQFAYDSHMKADKAWKSGRLAEETFPIVLNDHLILDRDEQIRPETSMEKLTKLKPSFDKEGSVTAGNSSSFNDGASFQLMTTEDFAKDKNIDIMAYLEDYSITGVEPEYMGLGPVKAIQNLLKDNNLDLKKDIDILEINEAFAAQVLGCMHELDIDLDSDYYRNSVNINGGAISLGHPLGMSGSRLIGSVLYEFKNNPAKKYAIVSACIGGGQGVALLLKNGYQK